MGQQSLWLGLWKANFHSPASIFVDDGIRIKLWCAVYYGEVLNDNFLDLYCTTTNGEGGSQYWNMMIIRG